MSQIIYACTQGLITQGIVQANEPMSLAKIFLDDPMNLLGVRTSLRTHTDTVDNVFTEYFEIGHFMEMLYEGSPKAFDILYTPEEHIILDSYDISILKSQSEELVSRVLVDGLINASKQLVVTLEDTGGEINFKENNKFIYEKLAYNNKNAYICIRNLLLSIELLRKGKYELSPSKLSLLQAIRDGSFSFKAIQEGYSTYMQEFEELDKISNLPLRPDLHKLNEILLEIRNVSIKTLNIERL